MKTIKAACLTAREIKTKDGGKLYKSAYATDKDVFVAYTTKEPSYGEEYIFIEIDGKYKKLDI